VENYPQIVFLGAGYDTRPYRFKDSIKQTEIFELDVPTKQQIKNGF
jgi:O-methyltransferase involved in polyketide biosynthesis